MEGLEFRAQRFGLMRKPWQMIGLRARVTVQQDMRS